jgi:phage-related protein
MAERIMKAGWAVQPSERLKIEGPDELADCFTIIIFDNIVNLEVVFFVKRWPVEFYRDAVGREPVKEWLENLPEEVRGKVMARIDLLAQYGPTLDFPYTSQIEGRLREIRMRFGKTRYRVLYFFNDDRTAVLLHGFTKETATVPEYDKNVAGARMKDHIGRVKRKGSSLRD